MALTPDERKTAESRIAEIGAQIDQINAALDESSALLDDETMLRRAGLVRERIKLALMTARSMHD